MVHPTLHTKKKYVCANMSTPAWSKAVKQTLGVSSQKTPYSPEQVEDNNRSLRSEVMS